MFGTSLLFVFAMMNVVFIVAAVLRKNDLADVAWGPGFILAGFGAWCATTENLRLESHPRFFLVFAMVSIWAVRLAFSVGTRNLSTLKEDSRYNKWRKEWGSTWLWRTYLQVFTLQSLILLVIATPLVYLANSPAHSIDLLAVIGAAIWFFGFVFEAIADFQLSRFKKDPKNQGRLMTEGLWSWSRHPNYFGEVIQWWGLFLVTATMPGAWIAILSPLAITFLILKVSGVSMLEEQMKDRPGAAEYRKRTSEFFPRPPR